MNQQRISEASRLQEILSYGADETVTSAWINLGDRNAVLFTLWVELFGTSVDAKILQATDDAGTGSKDLVQEGTTDEINQIVGNDEVARLEAYSSSLDLANDFTHVAIEVTSVGAANGVTYIESIDSERYNPDDQSSQVVQTVQDQLREGFVIVT